MIMGQNVALCAQRRTFLIHLLTFMFFQLTFVDYTRALSPLSILSVFYSILYQRSHVIARD